MGPEDKGDDTKPEEWTEDEDTDEEEPQEPGVNMRLDKSRFHHRMFRVMQESDSRCPNEQMWMTPRHEQ